MNKLIVVAYLLAVLSSGCAAETHNVFVVHTDFGALRMRAFTDNVWHSGEPVEIHVSSHIPGLVYMVEFGPEVSPQKHGPFTVIELSDTLLIELDAVSTETTTTLKILGQSPQRLIGNGVGEPVVETSTIHILVRPPFPDA